ncbi:HAD domain-containing protein [Amycolatopsis sp. NPDC059021]|uniref:HAD domain-containing protein n=1 Tax=Amycolatopsis sp. NPDC059021 TaxID=3346704 RepID=UPI00366B7CA4
MLLLDVDGPLSPWAAGKDVKPSGFVEHRFRLPGWSRRRPLRMWLNPALGPALLGLAGQAGLELVWATSWEHRANTMMGPAMGLPVLPVIEFPAGLQPRPGQPFTWKYGPVARYAAGRALAWLDDDFEVYPAARDRFIERRRAESLPTELIDVNPRTGITDDHLAAVAAWARSL